MIFDAHTCWHSHEMAGIRYEEGAYLDALDRCGIDRAMACAPFYLLSDFIAGNDRVIALAAKYPARIVGFATVNPLFGARAAAEVGRCAGEGMRGVKMHCDLSGVAYDDPATFPVVERAIGLGLPVFMHTGGGSARAARDLAARYPDGTFIFAHAGGNAWREACSFAREAENIVLCLSGLIFERGFLEEALEQAGEERVVFGSDFILADPSLLLGMVRASGLPEESRAKILGLNMKRILGL